MKKSFGGGHHTIREELKAVNYDTSKFIEGLTQNEDLSPEQLLAILTESVEGLAKMSTQIEAELEESQHVAQTTEAGMYQSLDVQIDKLCQIESDVETVLIKFDEASSGAMRLGERLATTEMEREKIEYAGELMSYIQHFQNIDPKSFLTQLQTCRHDIELKSRLPIELRRKDWGEISKVLSNLRRILYDISTEDVRRSEENIRNLSEAVERELLTQFESAVAALIEDPGKTTHIKKAQNLAQWLHLYNNGFSLQKRYIFSVVEKRIPVSSEMFAKSAPMTPLPSSGNQKPKKGKPVETKRDAVDAASLVDHLSELFMSISDICQEQFSIIRQVFPTQSASRVTKMLISRIFNDPAFGIQARVEAVLQPKPPSPPLSASDYLDALVTVREKLSALHLMLLEYCTDGVSVDEEDYVSNVGVNDSFLGNTAQRARDDQLEKEMLENRQRSEDLQAFIEDQVAQVFQTYLRDYFQKELSLLRLKLSTLLTRVFPESGLLSKSTDQSFPRLKPEKIRSLQQLIQSVANPIFITEILNLSNDTVNRMIQIGRDDAKKLPTCIKDVFILVLTFLSESVLIPWAKTMKLLADKVTATKRNSTLAPPPPEFVVVIAAFTGVLKKFRAHFEIVFSKPLSVQPNSLTICQESRRQAMKGIDGVLQAAVQSWISSLVSYFEKILSSLQSRHDYSPKFDSGAGGIEPTSACKRVCQHLIETINTANQQIGSDLKQTELFWKPFGKQFTAVLISHLKRQKVTEEGAFVLVRDMDEYYNVFALMDCPESLDLIVCLREIVYIFMTPSENVVKMVSEDLRHLNTHVVLSLLKSRVDYNPKVEWYPTLSTMFAAIKWDTPLPWERKGSSLGEQDSANSPATGLMDHMGPISLRKAAAGRVGVGQHSSSSSSSSSLSKGLNSSLVSRALVPSAEQMMSTALIGSSASRYAAIKERRTGFFLDTSHDTLSLSDKIQSPNSSNGSSSNNNNQEDSPTPRTNSDSNQQRTLTRRNSSTRGSSTAISSSTASAKSTMFSRVSSVFRSKSKGERESFS